MWIIVIAYMLYLISKCAIFIKTIHEKNNSKKTVSSINLCIDMLIFILLILTTLEFYGLSYGTYWNIAEYVVIIFMVLLFVVHHCVIKRQK